MTSSIVSEKELKRLTKKEYNKQYRAANKEKVAAKKSKYYQKNKEKIAAKGKEYRLANKEKIAITQKTYHHSKNGLIKNIYGHQKRSSKKRGHVSPCYSLEDLKSWVFSQSNFEFLFISWEDSGYNTQLTPSCDRLNDHLPYTIDNLQLTTWRENNLRGYEDRKAGINNKASKAVIQLTREGAVVVEHHSARHASRVTGVPQGNISACCRGEVKSAGNFTWLYAAPVELIDKLRAGYENTSEEE